MGKPIQLTKEQEERIVYNYTILKYGQKKAGAFIPVSDKIVKKVLIKHNISIKSIQETNTNKYNINHNYFKTQTPNMAYWIGILASDGSVNRNENQIYIELQKSDRELLEKLNLDINNEREVKDYETCKGYANSKLYFYSKTIKEDLKSYHIIPNKTYDSEYTFPEKLRKEYIFDYIRGLFDGDGCIKLTNTTITWQIDVGRKEIAEKIVDLFKEKNIILSIAELPKKNVTIYRVYGYTKEKCEKIYNLLYNTSSNLYMNRKKDKFRKLLNL